MATVKRQRSLLGTIIEAAAERLSLHPSIPPENREAFRATAVTVIEQQISAVIGYDTISISGWVVLPSARRARRERIEEALMAGDSVKAIAGRELVTPSTVFKIRAQLVAESGGNYPPEKLS